jgi:hypothetical protein
MVYRLKLKSEEFCLSVAIVQLFCAYLASFIDYLSATPVKLQWQEIVLIFFSFLVINELKTQIPKSIN